MQRSDNLYEIPQLEVQADNKLIGGKALNLYKVWKLGLSIPKTFIIPTNVFEEVIKQPEIKALLSNLDFNNISATAAELEQHLKEREGQISKDLTRKLKPYDRVLQASRLAVRSSANVEDGNRLSFAGQFDSVLDVNNDLAGIVTAVMQVYRSAYSLRSLSYCLANGVDPQELSMAVILQEMVPTQYAGTCFTKDLSGNNNDAIVIESTAEQGSKVVDGSGVTNVYQFKKDNITAAKGPSFIKKIARLALWIEADYQTAQDIEWAFDGARIFILQTRPITA